MSAGFPITHGKSSISINGWRKFVTIESRPVRTAPSCRRRSLLLAHLILIFDYSECLTVPKGRPADWDV